MTRKLRVFGWESFRRECGTHRHQTREICAAPSMAAVARAAGETSPRRLFALCETGNTEEVEIALAMPGIVFWKPLDARASSFQKAKGEEDDGE